MCCLSVSACTCVNVSVMLFEGFNFYVNESISVSEVFLCECVCMCVCKSVLCHLRSSSEKHLFLHSLTQQVFLGTAAPAEPIFSEMKVIPDLTELTF